MLKKTFLLLAGLMMAFAAQAQDFLGAWSGKLDLGVAKLTLVFHFSKDDAGKLKCAMDSPDQGAKGIPAEAEVTGEGKLRVSVSALSMTYEAQVNEKQMEGTFSQGGMQLPLVLIPGEAKPNRPQTPTPPYMYPTEEVTFINPADGVKLAGTLTYPMNFQFSKDVPVLVMVTGSGQQNRDEEVLSHKPFLVIADYLAKQGIATLRYDDRGVGGSTGEVANATTYDSMGDALAALDYVRSTGKFGKCGVLGHSEGGTIAMMEAALEGLTRPDGTRPLLIAVTQLTSTSEERMQNDLLIDRPLEEVVMHYAANTKIAGLDGVVCSPLEAGKVKEVCGKEYSHGEKGKARRREENC